MEDETLETLRFWFQRILVPCVVVIGVLGNFVSIIVLTRKRMRCSTNIYLTALAVADIFYLFFVFLLSLERYPNIHSAKHRFYWSTYALQHWLCDAASYTSIYLTVNFTIERYIAVCHPIRGQVLCTESRAKRVIAGVIIICCLMTITTAFEYKLVTYDEFRDKYSNALCVPSATNFTVDYTNAAAATTVANDPDDMKDMLGEHIPLDASNITERVFKDPCEKVTFIKAHFSDLGTNENYKYIFYISTSIVVTFIPLCLLATFNCFLIVAVHRSYRIRHKMTNTRQCDASTAQENKVTITLIAVVALFLLCQTPAAIMLIYSMMTDEDSNWLKAAGNICNFLVTLNAACNFLLYCALSAKYRKTVKQLFLGRHHRAHHHRQNTISSSYLSRYGTSQTSGTSLYNKSPSSFRGRGSGGAGTGSIRNRTPSTASTNTGSMLPRSSSANRFTISPTDYANFQAEMARQQLKTQQLAASDFDPNHNRSSAIPMTSLSPAHHHQRLLHNTPNDLYIPRSSSLVFPVATKHSPDCKDNPNDL